MKKVYCMWCLKNQPSKLSKSTGKILCAVCENSAVGIARRPTRRAADVANVSEDEIKLQADGAYERAKARFMPRR